MTSIAARMWRLVGGLAARPWLAISGVGLLVFSTAMTLSLAAGLPQPRVHDEFSYLLAADTFAQGRLTNPTHPMWEFFESEHIIHQPSYASKYPPAQGLVLALGQVVFGHPIVGSWLAAGLAVAAVTWMLFAWLPGRWALVGGLITAAHPLMVQWSQQYWGGLVAMIGGSLVLGAVRRIVREPKARSAIALGGGLVVLAASRPYEGLVLGLPLAVVLLLSWLRLEPLARRAALRDVVLPLGLLLGLGGAALLYYNARVTGDAFTLPYQVHERAYGTTPSFAFQEPVPIPRYRHPQLHDFHVDFERPTHLLRHSSDARERLLGVSRALLDAYFLGSLVVVCGVGLVLVRAPGRWIGFAALVLLVFVLGLSLETFVQPHYAAPAVGLGVLLVVQALRRVRAWCPRGVRVGPLLALALALLGIGGLAATSWRSIRAGDGSGWSHQRASILSALERTPQQDLVIVRYAARHDFHQEWVYNAADIDAAPVVWAREMDPEQTSQLLAYFHDRRVWLLEPDRPPAQPVPYAPR